MKKLTIAELENELKSIIADKKNKNPQYSARAFAKSLGFSDSLIYKVINNERHLSKRSAKEICKVLGYELDDSRKEITAPTKKHSHLKDIKIEFTDFSEHEFIAGKNKINSFLESLKAHFSTIKFDSETKLVVQLKTTVRVY